jgi:hypothetical protein
VKRAQDRQRIKRIEQILCHIRPLYLLNPVMACWPFSAELAIQQKGHARQ